MKKNRYLLGALFLIIAIVAIFLITQKGEKPKGQENSKYILDSNGALDSTNAKNTFPLNWKTYNSTQLGITFKYPDTWVKNGEESNAVNRKGETMSVSINFKDTLTDSNFYLTYHLAPYGAEVYRLAEEDYDTYKNSNEISSKRIFVSENNAIETKTTMVKDIKGNIYDPALILIHIVFQDKEKTGAYNLNFQTPEPGSEVEISKFNQLITTFKFAK